MQSKRKAAKAKAESIQKEMQMRRKEVQEKAKQTKEQLMKQQALAASQHKAKDLAREKEMEAKKEARRIEAIKDGKRAA